MSAQISVLAYRLQGLRPEMKLALILLADIVNMDGNANSAILTPENLGVDYPEEVLDALHESGYIDYVGGDKPYVRLNLG